MVIIVFYTYHVSEINEKIFVGNNSHFLINFLGMRAVAISVDCRQQFIYFTDTSGKTIQRMKYDGSEQKIILSGKNRWKIHFIELVVLILGLGSPEGIAIDWVSRLMFWTDSALRRLEVAKLDGSLRKVLLDKNIQNPRGIAVNPELGFVRNLLSTRFHRCLY